MFEQLINSKVDVSATVIVLLPFVAPAVIGGRIEGGGHGT